MAVQDDKQHHARDETENINITENNAYGIHKEYDSNGKGCIDVPLLNETQIDFTDPIQLDVLYIELRNSIINGTQPCTEVEAVVLAAYQCQVQYGNYNKEQHKIGFLNLSEFLPEGFLKVQGIENEIYSEHCKLIDMTEIDVKCCYITFCRSLKTYGGTYYHVKEKVRWHKNLVPYILGITPRAVLRMDKNTKEVLNEWPYTTVCRFSGKYDRLTLDFGDFSKSYYKAQTTEGEAICQIMTKYINTLMQNKKSHFDVSENEDASVTTKETTSRSLSIDLEDEPIYDQIQIDKLEEASGILDSHHLQEEVPQIQNDQLDQEEVSGILDSHHLQEEVLQIQDNHHQQQEEVAQLLTCEVDQYYKTQKEESAILTDDAKVMKTLREYFKKEFEIEKAELHQRIDSLQLHIDTLQSAYEKEKTDHDLALKAQRDKFEEEILHLHREINVLQASNTKLQFEKNQAISELQRLVAGLSVDNTDYI